ncbi:MAG: hypothetical protein LBF86_06175, partial [Helicobacteraceae bacterium]|nr:hypothetical protein [Helicobacteraceae bacterium]
LSLSLSERLSKNSYQQAFWLAVVLTTLIKLILAAVVPLTIIFLELAIGVAVGLFPHKIYHYPEGN